MTRLTDLQVATIDSTPKWFTEVDLADDERWTESTIHYVPTIEYDDTQFTRVVFDDSSLVAIQFPSAGE